MKEEKEEKKEEETETKTITTKNRDQKSKSEGCLVSLWADPSNNKPHGGKSSRTPKTERRYPLLGLKTGSSNPAQGLTCHSASKGLLSWIRGASVILHPDFLTLDILSAISMLLLNCFRQTLHKLAAEKGSWETGRNPSPWPYSSKARAASSTGGWKTKQVKGSGKNTCASPIPPVPLNRLARSYPRVLLSSMSSRPLHYCLLISNACFVSIGLEDRWRKR